MTAESIDSLHGAEAVRYQSLSEKGSDPLWISS